MNPIKRGSKDAREFKNECKYQVDLIIEPLDSGEVDSIRCKLIHFDGTYAVFLKNGTTISKTFLTGTKVIPEYFTPEPERETCDECKE